MFVPLLSSLGLSLSRKAAASESRFARLLASLQLTLQLFLTYPEISRYLHSDILLLLEGL